MYRTDMFIILTFIAICYLSGQQVAGHGMLMDPVGRASRWRVDRSAIPNYDDNGVYCGGYWKQWGVNRGNCGMCGDDYSLPTPRPNELGGRYGQGTIVKTYNSGSVIPVSVTITANHKGYFIFDLCDLDQSKETEQCYQRYPLKLSDGTSKFYISTATGKFVAQVRLPAGLKSNHAALRWTYVAGNNWGPCPNGGGALGCGPQEHFRSCADIKLQ